MDYLPRIAGGLPRPVQQSSIGKPGSEMLASPLAWFHDLPNMEAIVRRLSEWHRELFGRDLQ